MDRKTLEQKDRRFHEGFLRKAINTAGVGILIGISHLPFWVLYGISDILYLLMRFVLKYRYRVITQNLRNAFPGNTEKEIGQIRNKYYRHFCDLILESIKMYSMSEKQMEKRIRVKGYEKGNELFDAGTDVNEKDWLGYAPLHWACYFGYADLVGLLMDKGADPNLISDTGRTPVEITTAMDYGNITDLLREGETRE